MSDELKAAISGAKLGWTTEAGTEDDNENGGSQGLSMARLTNKKIKEQDNE